MTRSANAQAMAPIATVTPRRDRHVNAHIAAMNASITASVTAKVRLVDALTKIAPIAAATATPVASNRDGASEAQRPAIRLFSAAKRVNERGNVLREATGPAPGVVLE